MISTIGEHVSSWCPYVDTDLAAFKDNDELDALSRESCTYIHNGVCALATYGIKKTFTAMTPEVAGQTISPLVIDDKIC